MYVLKRDGRNEPVMFDKITSRIKKMCYGLNALVDPVKVAMRVIEGLYDDLNTPKVIAELNVLSNQLSSADNKMKSRIKYNLLEVG